MSPGAGRGSTGSPAAGSAATWRIGAGCKKPVPTLLLDHVGRKSGTPYTTPLLYLADGADVVVVASQGGLPKDPQWYRNLMAHPGHPVQIRGERYAAVRARTADARGAGGAVAAAGRALRRLRQLPAWTDREIPVVVLEPR